MGYSEDGGGIWKVKVSNYFVASENSFPEEFLDFLTVYLDPQESKFK